MGLPAHLDNWEKSVNIRKDIKERATDASQGNKEWTLVHRYATFQCYVHNMTAKNEVHTMLLTSIPGVKFVLPEHLCQDPLKASFWSTTNDLWSKR